jgi:hypothetical protein
MPEWHGIPESRYIAREEMPQTVLLHRLFPPPDSSSSITLYTNTSLYTSAATAVPKYENNRSRRSKHRRLLALDCCLSVTDDDDVKFSSRNCRRRCLCSSSTEPLRPLPPLFPPHNLAAPLPIHRRRRRSLLTCGYDLPRL